MQTPLVPVVFLCLLLAAGCAPEDREAPRGHRTADGFVNVHRHSNKGFGDFLKWRWERLWKDIPPAESYRFETADNDPAFLAANRDRTTLTWIGHATLLLQANGRNILTDPVFSERASPVQWAGPKRVVPPGIALADLPKIDVVLISHDHYDALDKHTVRALRYRAGGDATRFFVPLGLKAWFADQGIDRVVELDWWRSWTESGMEVTAVPVQHWSKRTPFSRNRTLWAGWVVAFPDFRFFFSGDSGYCPHFAEIGKRLGPFDLAAIPIGAYEPRWFMRAYHMDPEEAVQVHRDIRARTSVGIHWGTFILTDEPLTEPPVRLRAALAKAGVAESAFRVLQHGETLLLDSRNADAAGDG